MTTHLCDSVVPPVRCRLFIYPLADNQPAMFARSFSRSEEADDYEAMWRRPGCCRIERVSAAKAA